MELKTSSYNLTLENFHGPLDLLLHLIQKNEMDIYDIKINEITDQYMDYLYSMEQLDIEIASEFLVMASMLLHIKSRTLLPKKKDEEEVYEEDPRIALISQLIEYRKYKNVSKLFSDREMYWTGSFTKEREYIKFNRENEIIELNPYTLRDCMVNINIRNSKKLNDNKDKMKRILQREKVSLKDKMLEVLHSLKKRKDIMFSHIFKKEKDSKLVVVTGFQAILELSKIKKVSIHQKKPFEDIKIIKSESFEVDINNIDELKGYE